MMMVRNRALGLVMCVAVLLLSLCACQSSTPSETTDGISDLRAPGTLTDLALIPKADTSDINQAVTISFRDLWEKEQFQRAYATTEGDYPFAFVYIYNPKINTGRLVTLHEKSEDASICTLTIYEPSWSGGLSLCNVSDLDFDAVIVDRLNITYTERRYMDYAAGFDSYYVSPDEIIDVGSYSNKFQDDCVQFYFGEVRSKTAETELHWHPIDSELKMALKANTQEHASPEFQRSLDVFLRIVSRYDLNEKLGI